MLLFPSHDRGVQSRPRGVGRYMGAPVLPNLPKVEPQGQAPKVQGQKQSHPIDKDLAYLDTLHMDLERRGIPYATHVKKSLQRIDAHRKHLGQEAAGMYGAEIARLEQDVASRSRYERRTPQQVQALSRSRGELAQYQKNESRRFKEYGS